MLGLEGNDTSLYKGMQSENSNKEIDLYREEAYSKTSKRACCFWRYLCSRNDRLHCMLRIKYFGSGLGNRKL